MAVNGIELEIGQRWIRRDGVEVEVIGHFPGREWPFLVAPVVKDCERRSYSVGADGFAVDADTPHKNDLTLLVRGSDLPTLPKADPRDENVVTSAQVNDWIEWHGGECPLPEGTPFDVRFRSGVEGYGCESVSHLLRWDHTGLAGDVVAYRPVTKVDPLSDEHEALTFHDIQPVGVGDINSDAKGSGARYNTGKPPLELIPLSIIVPFFSSRFDDEDDRLSLIEADLTDAQQRALRALDALGMFQARKGHVYDVLRELGDHWDGCAQVFDYGRQKYAEWNWAKGMKWSIPIACAARHLLAIIRGETHDPESGKPHEWHVYCNVVMLLTFASTFTEGDDRPTEGMLL